MSQPEGLPEWLTKALVTTEPAGYKPLGQVIDDIVEEGTTDRATARITIDQYIERGQLERFGRKNNRSDYFIRDPLGSHRVRVSMNELNSIRKLLTVIPIGGLHKIDIAAFANKYGFNKHAVSCLLDDLVGKKILKSGGRGTCSYGWDRLDIAAYEHMSYTGGIAYDIDKLEVEEEAATDLPTEPTTSNMIIVGPRADSIEETKMNPLELLCEAMRDLETKITLHRQLNELADTLLLMNRLTPSVNEKITDLHRELCDDSFDTENAQIDLVQMKKSLEVWERHLT